MGKQLNKKQRQAELIKQITDNPFLTDEDLARLFNVSIQTIRLDRLELGIPELRRRTKNLAQEAYTKLKALSGGEVVGELLDLKLGESALSLLEATEDMVFSKTKIVRGHHIFAQANSLALAVIDADVALTGVSNIKYKFPVFLGDKLLAKAEVYRVRGNKHFVAVRTKVGDTEVFRAKFIMVALNGMEQEVER
ncbi:MAG TPA: transcription factor FapR [Clostridia bacterium]|jgi:acyl-coenzyme A thioesterase PaaI-like protein|nr:transcription factor FapR [Clostridia bacterium]